MKCTVPLANAARVVAVSEYLRETLSPQTRIFTGGCLTCGIPAPSLGVCFEVREPIQTCHSESGRGLDSRNGNSLPPGRYRVTGADHHQPMGSRSHWLKLVRLDDDAPIELCYGYSQECCMDWREIKKLDLATVEREQAKKPAASALGS